MKDFSNNVVLLFVVSVVALIGIVAMILVSSGSDLPKYPRLPDVPGSISSISSSADSSGFAVHPLYSGYALPFAFSSSSVNTFLQFSDVSSSVSRSFDVSDTVIYNRGYVSYDGQQWTPFTLTTNNAVSGSWIYTKATASVAFTPSQLRMSLSRNVSNNTYVVVYSCSKTPSNTWDCHNGWQIIKFDAKLSSSTPIVICTSNTKECLSSSVSRQCNSAGTAWVNTNCPNEQTCSGAGICSTSSVLDSTDLAVCLSAGYNCGTPTISGSSRNCGNCPSGLTCSPNNLCVSTSGKTLYVAPSTNGGSDNNNGDINHPLATINKAWSYVSAGDIVYVRGGTYTYSMMGETSLSGKSGTAGNMINIWNYPGEKPIIDFSANTLTSQIIGIAIQNVNYVYLKGIRVTSINQPHSSTIAQYGFILWDHVSNSIFEQMETDHIGGWGTVIGDASNNNLFLNCDSHHNSDRYTTNGDTWGWSDGFQSMSYTQTYQGQASTGNIFRGCRSYWNSDDGWDLRRASGVWTFENCWAFWNGYKPGEKLGDPDIKIHGGNGEGIKLGGNFEKVSSNDIKRTTVNTLSFENWGTGYGLWYDAPDGVPIGMHIYNSIAYKNNNGFGCSDDTGVSTTAFRNDISFANTNGDYWPYPGPIWFVHDHNSWDISGITITDSDFLSLDSSCMDDARKADGSLPDCDFLKPSSTSKLIGAGVHIDGLTTDGAGNLWKSKPSIGAYEYYP